MTSRKNSNWSLNAFLDSLVLELDKARETLAIKGVNHPLTYAVKDFALELQLFPEFDGQDLRFSNAAPGDSGASKMSIQLGSISDRQIRETTKAPVADDDIAIDHITEIDEQTKKQLRKMGVSSVKDIEKLEQNQVKLDQTELGLKTDVQSLASRLKGIRQNKVNHHKKQLRQQLKPLVRRVSMQKGERDIQLQIEGENLAIEQSFQPRAMVNQRPAAIMFSSPHVIQLNLKPNTLKSENQVEIILDPYSIVHFNLK